MPIILDGTSGVTTPTILLSTSTLQTPVVGEFEYDGKVPYFIPQGLERGIIPGMQYYRLNSALAGANATGAQNTLGVGVSLSANTTYAFEFVFCITKSAGTTSHTISNIFGGTATINNIGYTLTYAQSATTGTVNGGAGTTTSYSMYIQQSSATIYTPAIITAAQAVFPTIKGTVSISSGGTFIPQYLLSAIPGGAYTTQLGSYFAIYPISTAGSNTSIGTWA